MSHKALHAGSTLEVSSAIDIVQARPVCLRHTQAPHDSSAIKALRKPIEAGCVLWHTTPPHVGSAIEALSAIDIGSTSQSRCVL